MQKWINIKSLLMMLLIFLLARCTVAIDLKQQHQNCCSLPTCRNFDDDSWIKSNFPLAAESSLIGNLSEQCLKDIKTQMGALKNGLPWAVESKLYKSDFYIVIKQ